jgi:universal stress protein E
MRRFRNILAVIDTSYDNHPALEQAARLLRSNGARVMLADVVPEFSWPARLTLSKADEIRDAVVQTKTQRLAELIEPLQQEGLPIAATVLHGKTSEAIIGEVARNGHDLVIRVTKGKRSRREGFLGTTSLKLMRVCPCAVWLTKPDNRPEYHRIVAAVDASAADDTHCALNRSVLDLATSLGKDQDSRVDVVYAWTLFGENVLREHMRTDEFEDLVKATQCDQQQALDTLLRQAAPDIGPDRIHTLHGDASYEIPRFLHTHESDLLIMGTVCRRGVAGFFIGNTAERILDKVHCSVLAVKPDGLDAP